MKTVFQRLQEFITSKNTKEWTQRRFKFYILFGKIKNDKAPWNKTEWNEIYEPLLNKILQVSSEQKNTGVKVLAYRMTNANSEHYSQVKFGALRWDQKSHEKWTTENSSDIKVNRFESWTPNRTICDKRSSAPDVFISIQNEDDSKQGAGKPQFDVFVVIAIAEDLAVDCSPAIIEISKRINARRTICHVRRWNRGKKDKDGNWNFYNWIQDTWSNGIYKGESLHNFSFEQLVFEPYWETIYKEE